MLAAHHAFVCSSVSINMADARAAARDIVAQMNFTEMASLLQGVGFRGTDPLMGHYVGNLPGVPRLGIPPIYMQDSSAGFRTYWDWMVGTVTVWPCLLALSATWDPALVRRVSRGIAVEFQTKGANTVLGPGVNVQRVARAGRNFEYLSGEDPALGSKLVAAYVQGVHDVPGMMAVVKHFAFNQQETHRTTETSMVDSVVAWEMYYPPFEAAVRANVSGVMCSYNEAGESSTHTCESAQLLSEDLKTKMGFRGFVVSDWCAPWKVQPPLL